MWEGRKLGRPSADSQKGWENPIANTKGARDILICSACRLIFQRVILTEIQNGTLNSKSYFCQICSHTLQLFTKLWGTLVHNSLPSHEVLSRLASWTSQHDQKTLNMNVTLSSLAFNMIIFSFYWTSSLSSNNIKLIPLYSNFLDRTV